METKHNKITMGKKFWGKSYWDVIHISAATLTPENSKDFLELLWLYTKIMPCDNCKEHLITKLKMVPPEPFLQNNHDAFFYTYILHDLVNQYINETRKPSPPKISPPFDEIKFHYFTALGQECEGCGKI